MDTYQEKEFINKGGTTMAVHDRSQPPALTLVSLAVAAETYGVSIKTLRRRISDGTVHGYRVGRLIRVDADELREKLLIEMPSAK
ncbi:helix-turn-helix domain-containing protein [Microbacterium esteraromaticum]|uniref:helix-turn-helix domain-containing protein n=1 Tax=Microbacterium esteraromaticum TaxID=57043 RepID=UPI0021BD9CBC|nr:helix-turn-helix domain-containing protein [Microbacterium esteraromaticum]